MSLTRHHSREIVFQILFSWSFRHPSFEKNAILQEINEYVESFQPANSQGEQEADQSHAFLLSLASGIIDNMTTLQTTIQQYAQEWSLDKMNPVDRTILYIGTYEILFEENIPDIVAINESIELAKNYGNESSGKFVNGVLNAIMMHKQASQEEKKNE